MCTSTAYEGGETPYMCLTMKWEPSCILIILTTLLLAPWKLPRILGNFHKGLFCKTSRSVIRTHPYICTGKRRQCYKVGKAEEVLREEIPEEDMSAR